MKTGNRLPVSGTRVRYRYIFYEECFQYYPYSNFPKFQTDNKIKISKICRQI
jgi:hypothetical protein